MIIKICVVRSFATKTTKTICQKRYFCRIALASADKLFVFSRFDECWKIYNDKSEVSAPRHKKNFNVETIQQKLIDRTTNWSTSQWTRDRQPVAVTTSLKAWFEALPEICWTIEITTNVSERENTWLNFGATRWSLTTLYQGSLRFKIKIKVRFYPKFCFSLKYSWTTWIVATLTTPFAITNEVRINVIYF